MENIKNISTVPPRTSMHYAALREKGLELISRFSEETWSDHNIHDPGISFLEAFSYAATDIGFRIQLDIPDLIRSAEKYSKPDHIPAHKALTCAPVTLDDFRKTLLDHHLLVDARLKINVESEIPFYHDELSTPPITYTVGENRVTISGLYEVLVEFNDGELNSNNYSLDVDIAGVIYTFDIALPYWDDKEATHFYNEVNLDSVSFLNPGTGEWIPLEEKLTYFAQIKINYTGPDGADEVDVWILLRIVNDLEETDPLIPTILAQAITSIETTTAESLMATFSQRVYSSQNGINSLQRYLYNWRNLTEFPVKLSIVKAQEIAVTARIGINNDTDPESLLASIFFAIDNELSPPLAFSSLKDLLDSSFSTSDVYDGPLLKHGFLINTNDNNNLVLQTKIYVSDILRLIMKLRSSDLSDLTQQELPTERKIIAVSDLGLSNYINNRVVTKDAKDCLRLVEVERYRPKLSIAKSSILFIRDDIKVDYDFNRVEELFNNLVNQKKADYTGEKKTIPWPVITGDSLPVDDYFPYQNELPINYGVGEVGLPTNATKERKAQALQTKAYLLLTEQFLGDVTSQLANLNHFFSSAANETQTYFTHPIFDLPQIDKLLKQYSPEDDWFTFIEDPNNPYKGAIQNAIENRASFIDRRNRMLDHLLARHGMESMAWAQELHRWGHKEVSNLGLAINDYHEKLITMREAINIRLIKTKSIFLNTVADLNATRLQAFSNPLHRYPQMLKIESHNLGYQWQIIFDGDIVFQSIIDFDTKAAAKMVAEEAVILATQALYYFEINAGGGRLRFVLRYGENVSDQIIAESKSTWSSTAATQNAIQKTVNYFSELNLSNSLTSMERLIAHQTGLNSKNRRKLLVNIDDFFEIYDEVDTDAIIEKRWRLWSNEFYTGSILLSSVFHFTAPTTIVDPVEQQNFTTALARDSIQQVVEHGFNEWNYFISPAGVDTYNFELRKLSGDKIGLHNSSLATIEETKQEIEATVNQLFDLYSVEGFHMVEHILLRPLQDTDPFLSIPVNYSDLTEKEVDPYSHRISFIFPSGYSRNFSLPDDLVVLEEVSPGRFRDLEFRKYMERIIQQTCPAHIYPMIYWVDQQLPGSPDSSASFNSFEERYFSWLSGILVPGTDEELMTNNRTALIESLNEIANV